MASQLVREAPIQKPIQAQAKKGSYPVCDIVLVVVALLFAGGALGGHFGEVMPPWGVYLAAGLSIASLLALAIKNVKSSKAPHIDVTIEDLRYMVCLENKQFSVRNSGSQAAAQEEKFRGCAYADAFNIDPSSPFWWDKHYPGDRDKVKSKLWELQNGHLSLDEQTKLIDEWRKDVKKIFRDYGITSESGVILILSEGNKGSYDDSYPLGKMGNRGIPPIEIVAVLEFPEEGLKGEALVDHYFRDLILAIREVRNRATALQKRK